MQLARRMRMLSEHHCACDCVYVCAYRRSVKQALISASRPIHVANYLLYNKSSLILKCLYYYSSRDLFTSLTNMGLRKVRMIPDWSSSFSVVPAPLSNLNRCRIFINPILSSRRAILMPIYCFGPSPKGR